MKKTTRIEAVEDVLDALDIVVSSKGDREIACHCPFHADRHPSFSINKETGFWICYQCGEHGNLESLIKKVKEGIDPVSLLRPLRRRTIGQRLRTARVEHEEPAAVDPLLVQAEYESFQTPPEWALQDRLLDPGAATRYGLKWNKGWVIPVWSPEAELWGWQFKRLDLVRNYPSGVKKSKTLFGLRETKSETAFLVESPLDVVRMASVGVEGGVASFGAMVSNAQMRLLMEHFDHIVVALDNDREGKQQGKKVYQHLNRLIPAELFEYRADVKDPGEMTRKQLVRSFSVYR